MPTFAQLGLLDNLIKALPDTFPGPTPLQALAVPTLLQGRDLIALAPDGAGKTVAWSLSVLHKMARPPVSAEPNAPRALVLVHSPARAESVAVDISHLGRYVPVRHTAAEDGSSWNRTVSALKGGIEILVATPRQFLDLWKQRELKLHGVEIVVIDDAEQLLDGMHQDSLDQLLPELPVGRQTAMFTSSSAPELRSIAVLWLTKPVAIKPPPVATQLKGLEGPIHLPEWLNDVPEVVLPDWLSDPDEEAPKPERKVGKGAAGKGAGAKPAVGKAAPKAPVAKPAVPSKRPAAGPAPLKKPPRPGPGKRG
ncbi:MAG: DEAD/DEAH box helicase [Planctomycetota bacterium]